MGDLEGMRRRISGPVHGGDELGRVDEQVGLRLAASVERGLAGVVRRG